MAKIITGNIRFSPAESALFIRYQRELRAFRSPYTENAGQKIADKLGVISMRHLEYESRTLHQIQIELIEKGDFASAQRIVSHPKFNFLDYFIPSTSFTPIHLAINSFVGLENLRGKNVLQIAANWGPYMHYLQQKHNVNIFGIDMNDIAVSYAREGGLDFTVGDSSDMRNYGDNSMDMVLSRNFMQYAYLSVLSKDPSGFMDKTILEIYRVLKPGGIFFSYMEDAQESGLIHKLFQYHILYATPDEFAPVHVMKK